ncbi:MULTISPECIES: FUSC family protein [Streptomyces]|uniref:FUSC family protein n=1 Tax=Streptomyces mirabilis TaxID=68239 RepID=A0ABU3UW63_9ACTN|nr:MULTISPECIES: FUSC family protein [Streptomyces]MCX4607982.1 FUSC family protein [Streptomyces mirabilis]MCX5348447.1 FUSC family protein [Streptomyces mirabilis]MDU8998152.1 FUSC family protein [Streptomyces mirabilis]QDN87041.1 FUSC family protein [Streptomyces sp. RLB3-6]QDO07854.1 FUSC family protein [Streptomyces sp. S1D4-23]
MSRLSAAVPPWLAHALRAQRGPVPWSAVVRGALAAGPLLLVAVLSGRTSVGVVAALGAMLAGINDRPGSRRAAVRRLGVPALAGAGGLLVGSYAGQHVGAVTLTLLLTVLGLLAGAVSAVGPVASGAGTQLLVAAAIGAGMPLPEPGWQRALFFVGGAGWLLVLRLALPTPGAIAGDYRFDGERDAVGGVYDAVAALLEAVGGPDAPGRRVALTAALDHAQDALGGPRLRPYASSAAERRLHAQYAAALPLAEAATALAWAGEAVPARAVEGPRRLAVAVRTSTHTGPLPAPARSAPALRALDDALLHAADTFDRGGDDSALHTRRRTATSLARTVLGSAGREYGLRVALCFGAGVAVAQALHHARWYGSHAHWYWLPATAVFLVKPDLGPLASRVICRAAGTVLGAVLFAGFAALLPRPAGLVALVALCGALIPVATRHFAAQTAVVTVLVLSLVMVGGEPGASWSRIGETLLACAIVLLVGHLPALGQRGGGVRARLTHAAEAAHVYLAHVLGDGTTDDRAGRWTLRREAYRALAEARASIDLAAAELPALARHAEGTDEVAATLERLVDTTTACAVQLDDNGRLTPEHTERITALLDELAEGRERAGLVVKEGQTLPVPLAG